MTKILKGFWVLEGLDGAGTTTQLRLIDAEFKSKKIESYITQEPTINETGKIIRRVLSGEIKVQQSTIAYMFAADRNDHLTNPVYGIRKKLDEGRIVISDRYFFSSLAYQTIGFDWNRVQELNSAFEYPEVVIYIDTPVEDCINRINKRGMSKEIYEKYEYQKLVHENYEKCFENLPEDCMLLRIDGLKSKEEIFNIIKKQLIEGISK